MSLPVAASPHAKNLALMSSADIPWPSSSMTTVPFGASILIFTSLASASHALATASASTAGLLL